MNLLRPGLTALALLCFSPLLGASKITLDDVNADRVDDINRDGIGDRVISSFLVLGNAKTPIDFHPVIVFQMTGTKAPSSIQTAQLYVNQVDQHGPPQFKQVDLFALRTSDSPEVLPSDYELEGSLIMKHFAGFINFTAKGSRVTSTPGQAALTRYLHQHWEEGKYIFFTLRGGTDAVRPYANDKLNAYGYGNSTNGWTPNSCGAQLSIYINPESSNSLSHAQPAPTTQPITPAPTPSAPAPTKALEESSKTHSLLKLGGMTIHSKH
ncbi:hypothetical protein [Rubritalea marina]|uniref:hypothetical protein n=1 Tax=Rubritalea marina TaxID=361055 RepID=UPI000373431D|nr:hypothetical protein [Rubritalea marina]